MTKTCFLQKELITAKQKVEEIKSKLSAEQNTTVKSILENEDIIVIENESQGNVYFARVNPNGHDFTTVAGPMFHKLGYILKGFSKAYGEENIYQTWWILPEDLTDD